MEFSEALEKLQESSIFKEWHKKNKGSYLAHGFYMEDSPWQIGYYSPDSDSITTFTLSDDIEKAPDSELFKEGGKVLKLVPESVKVTLSDALRISDDVQKERYRSHIPTKRIFVLQHLPVGQVWNVTYVTKTLNTLNIKIDTITGTVVSDEILSIFRVDK